MGEELGKLLCHPCLSSAPPSVLVPPAIFSHLPDFIRDDLPLAFTIDGSEGPLPISDTLWKALALFASVPRASFFRALVSLAWEPGVGTPWGGIGGGQPGTGKSGVASGVYLPMCPWTSEFVWQQLSLRLRGRQTCLGMSGGAGWPSARLREDCRDPREPRLDSEAWLNQPWKECLSQGRGGEIRSGGGEMDIDDDGVMMVVDGGGCHFLSTS